MAVKDYLLIADCFEKALIGTNIPPAFVGAIKAMKAAPATCAKIKSFDDTVFSIIQDYLNSGAMPVDQEYFLYGVSLLDA